MSVGSEAIVLNEAEPVFKHLLMAEGSLSLVRASAQGEYLVQLTQLTRLSLLVQEIPLAAVALGLAGGNRSLRLDAYPASLRDIEVVLANNVEIDVQSFLTASADALTVFRALDSTRQCSLVFADAAGLLTGQRIEVNVHSLEVPMRSGGGQSSPVGCLLDWVARSKAQSLTLQLPEQDGLGHAMYLKASKTSPGGYRGVEFRVFTRQLCADLKRLSPRFGLLCTRRTGSHSIVLRQASA